MKLSRRLRLSKSTPWVAERVGPWSTASLLTRCALFVVGIVAVGLTAALLSALAVGAAFFVSGAMSVLAAEWLIMRGRLFGGGVEEALEAAGLVLMSLQLL